MDYQSLGKGGMGKNFKTGLCFGFRQQQGLFRS
jgi:hypothetical protein